MAGRAGAILPIALGVVLARWGGAVGAPRPSQRLRAAAIRRAVCRPRGSGKACIRIAGYPVYNEHFPLSAYFRIALSNYPPPH